MVKFIIAAKNNRVIVGLPKQTYYFGMALFTKNVNLLAVVI